MCLAEVAQKLKMGHSFASIRIAGPKCLSSIIRVGNKFIANLVRRSHVCQLIIRMMKWTDLLAFALRLRKTLKNLS